uniref:Ig-like domain-containing protein n=1 Tax=Acanthochromis polyacanthus TaxID=80966 RepID=A0A3Q1EGU5_9TELE
MFSGYKEGHRWGCWSLHLQTLFFVLFFCISFIFSAAVTQHRSSFTVRVGDEATLPCEDVKDLHDKCRSVTWIFDYLTTKPSVTLFESGKIHREAAAKSYRLSVTEKCSLVIKKVTYEDAGRYTCRQFIPGQPVTDSWVDLSVIKSGYLHHNVFIFILMCKNFNLCSVSTHKVQLFPGEMNSLNWFCLDVKWNTMKLFNDSLEV